MNTDSNEVDRLYPESIDKTTESANSGLRERVSGLSRYHSRVERSELRSEGKLSCIPENPAGGRNRKSGVKIYSMTRPKELRAVRGTNHMSTIVYCKGPRIGSQGR